MMFYPAGTLLHYSSSTDVTISYDTVLDCYGSQVNIANLNKLVVITNCFSKMHLPCLDMFGHPLLVT